ncbi:LppM family (lipo)protein [Demequina sp. NBRC 110057]|uniref:LppM family (lipo)protein n=1 Tax=Demequina sp. NBRC 110057 TaxID=1570346 RepID=UPI000A044DA1|nr:hypothetical protein [Demequina sp. NBRC 110057]
MSASSPRLAAAALVAGLALTGCVRATVDTTIGADDTFSQHTVVAYSDDAAHQLTDYLGADVDALVGGIADSDDFLAFQAAHPGQVTLADYDDGELTGVELTLTDIPLDDFTEASTQALASVDASATLSDDDGQYVLTVTRADGADLSALAPGGANLELAEAAVDVAATFTFPGLVTEATAGDIDGHTVTLGLADLATTPEIRIVADATPAVNWGPILVAGGVALGLAVIIGGAAWLIVDDRRTSRRTSLPPHATGSDPSGPGVLDRPE